MQISKNKDNKLEVKTKKATLLLNHGVTVNDVELEGAGEYEIGEVVIEGISDDVYLCQAEDIVFAIVSFKEKLSKENIEKLSSVSLLFCRVNGNLQDALEQINQIEPNVAVYAGNDEDRAKLKTAGVTLEQEENIKVAKSDLEGDQKAYFVAID